jgi:catechol 1,2-dioxygenase
MAHPYFDAANSAEVVLERLGPAASPRTRQVMTSIVRHLHEVVKETRPTHEEWLEAIGFLTRTGHLCSDWRQEFILLSDTLGVTMLVDALNHPRGGHATEHTILGPFYVANAPHYPNGADLCLDHKGQRLEVRGKVLDLEGRPIAGATIDAWQTNEDGFYDVQQKGVQPDMNLRGVFTSDATGAYWFTTVKPRYYPIPDDGPVGQLLTAMDRGPERAAHIHFIVKAAGFQPVITHVFTPDCPFLEKDAVFGVKQSLIGDFRKTETGWALEWTFVLAR